MPARIPCGEPRNLLMNQYLRWRASVFLKTITSECANIPAFSYLLAQVFIALLLSKGVPLLCAQYPTPCRMERNR